LGPTDDPNQGIYTGDCKELAPAIPDESVDLIFTDPVYQRIDDYRWLAETAARVLKPDSACLAWYGIGYLDEVIPALCGNGLHYRWNNIVRIVARQKKAYCDMGWSFYMGLLWAEKGRMKARRSRDLLTVPFRENGQHPQYAHSWGKSRSAISEWVSAFSRMGDVVVDFFVGESAPVPAVCKMLGRRWLAFEIDPDVAETARQRVRQTQPPLFTLPHPEQMSMEGI